MIAIYKRELKSYFHSFIGLLFIGFTLFFIGLYFTVNNLLNGIPYFSYTLSGVLFLFMISVPILTMKVLAEEKKQKTDQLILTAPVTVSGIVIGKFLALSTIFFIPCFIAGMYPIILVAFGSVPLSEAYLAVLAFFLYGETCIAIGVFVSSLTESQVISAVITFALLFLGYMMSSICSLISSTGNTITKILSSYDLFTRFYYMTQGTLNLESIAYYISITVLVLFLTVQAIQKRRYSVSVNRISIGAYSTGMIIIALAVTVIFNLAVSQIPDRIKSVDITSSKMYTLTEETKNFLKTIDSDVSIYVLSGEQDKDTTVAQTLDRYTDYCKNISVEYVNPAVNPNFALKYTSSNITYGSLIIVNDKRHTVIDASDLYETTYDYQTYTSSTTGYDGEGQITSALDYVLRDDVTKVYFTNGHGEMAMESNITEGLNKANIETDTLTLLQVEAVPEDSSCLIIAAPSTDFSADDTRKVKDYLERGGKVIAIYGYTETDMTHFDELLSYMGLSITDGLVVEMDQKFYYQNPYLLLPDMTNDIYTEGIVDGYYVYAPFSQGIQIMNTEAEGMSYTSFLNTSEDAFARIGYNEAQTLEKTEEDENGPFSIGICAKKTVGEQTATMILYSCQQIFTDQVNQAVSGANQKLFMNTVNSLIEEQASNVSIPVKSYDVSYLMIASSKVILLGVVTTVVLPLFSILTGFVIWLNRRKR